MVKLLPESFKLAPKNAFSTLLLVAALFFTAFFAGNNVERIINERSINHMMSAVHQGARDLRVMISSTEQQMAIMADMLSALQPFTDEKISEHLHQQQTGMLLSAYSVLFPDNHMVYAPGKPHLFATKPNFIYEKARGKNFYGYSRSIPAKYGNYSIFTHPIVVNHEVKAILFGYVNLQELPEKLQIAPFAGQAAIYVLDGKTGDLLVDTWHKGTLGNILDTSLRDRESIEGVNFRQIKKEVYQERSGYGNYLSHTINNALLVAYAPVGYHRMAFGISIPYMTVYADALLIKHINNILVMVMLAFTLIYIAYQLNQAYRKSKRETELTALSIAITKAQTVLLQAYENSGRVNESLALLSRDLQASQIILVICKHDLIKEIYSSTPLNPDLAEQNLEQALPLALLPGFTHKQTAVQSTIHSVIIYQHMTELWYPLTQYFGISLHDYEFHNVVVTRSDDRASGITGMIYAFNVGNPTLSQNGLETLAASFCQAVKSMGDYRDLKGRGELDALTGLKNRSAYQRDLVLYDNHSYMPLNFTIDHIASVSTPASTPDTALSPNTAILPNTDAASSPAAHGTPNAAHSTSNAAHSTPNAAHSTPNAAMLGTTSATALDTPSAPAYATSATASANITDAVPMATDELPQFSAPTSIMANSDETGLAPTALPIATTGLAKLIPADSSSTAAQIPAIVPLPVSQAAAFTSFGVQASTTALGPAAIIAIPDTRNATYDSSRDFISNNSAISANSAALSTNSDSIVANSSSASTANSSSTSTANSSASTASSSTITASNSASTANGSISASNRPLVRPELINSLPPGMLNAALGPGVVLGASESSNVDADCYPQDSSAPALSGNAHARSSNANTLNAELPQNSFTPDLWGCIYIDVNGLHDLNNTCGHNSGDIMLKTIARLIRKSFGFASTYRIGGDEFVVISQGRTEHEIASILHGMQIILDTDNYHISSGYALVKQGEHIHQTLVNAEAMMYANKKAYYANGGAKRTARKRNEEIESVLKEKHDHDAFLQVISHYFLASYLLNLKEDRPRIIYRPQNPKITLKENESHQLFLQEYSEIFFSGAARERFLELTDYDRIQVAMAKGQNIEYHFTRNDGLRFHLRIMPSPEYSDNKRDTIWIYERSDAIEENALAHDNVLPVPPTAQQAQP